MNDDVYDFIVIGAGLAGLMTARELVSTGLKVAVFERNTVGRESSWAGGGILSPLYPWRENTVLHELTTLSRVIYPDICRELLEATGIDPEWQQCGLLSLNVDDADIAQGWGLQHDFSIDVVDSDQLRHDFNLDPQNSGATLWCPDVAQVRNPRLISALKTYLVQSGVEILERTGIDQLVIKQGKLQSVKTPMGDFSAAVVVVANGAWASDLLPDIKIRPVRGQMLCYKAIPGFLSHIRLKNTVYIIPRMDGHILAGSTVEEAGYDKSITEYAKHHLSDAAEEILPGINQYPLSGHWSGLRPATPAGIPCICAHPEIDGLYVNAGHFRNGILLAAGAGRLVADLILKRKPTVDPSAFDIVGV